MHSVSFLCPHLQAVRQTTTRNVDNSNWLPSSTAGRSYVDRIFKDRTHPFDAFVILWNSGLHCSQKYSSGNMDSSSNPIQPPCCQTLQLSHWTKKLPVSSVMVSASGCCCLRASEGPGYSACPQMQRVTSSSAGSMSFSSCSICRVAAGSFSSPFRLLRRGWVCSAAREVESAPSLDSDRWVEGLRGEFGRWSARVSRSGFELVDVVEFV